MIFFRRGSVLDRVVKKSKTWELTFFSLTGFRKRFRNGKWKWMNPLNVMFLYRQDMNNIKEGT